MKHCLVFALALGCFACLNREDAVTSQSQGADRPGQLRLAPISEAKVGVQRDSLQSAASPVFEFDLGVANSSTQRFFILKNLGDRDVRNIVLTTNNPHFYFSPSKIKVLPPSKNSSVLQVITLNVIHGNRLDGLGPDSLLLMGDNAAGAHIAGVTTNSAGDSLVISEDVGFQISANVLDLTIYKSDGTVADLSQYGLDYGAMQALTPDPVRTYWNIRGETVGVVNTGNAAFTLRVWRMEGGSPVLSDTLEMQSGDRYQLAPGYAEIDGHGVITNPLKLYLQPASNGKIYLAL